MDGRGIVPAGEALRAALRWLAGRRDGAAIEQASRRFDLSPLDEQFLLQHLGAATPGEEPAAMESGAEHVRAEIEDLHRCFVDWFGGRCENGDGWFERHFRARFDAQFEIVLPGGTRHRGDEFLVGLRAAHGSNPDFAIRIREVAARPAPGGLWIATYQEWQRNARQSLPANNARLTSALLAPEAGAPCGLVWLHAHETWLPEQIAAAGCFDF